MRSASPGDVRAVLFDVDGTLIDSGYHHALAWWRAFRMQGVDVAVSTIHRAIGMGAGTLIPHLVREEQLDAADLDPDELESAHDAIFSTYWPELRRLRGARELIARCHQIGLRTVLASSAGGPELAVLRRVLDADEWLDSVTGSDDAEQSKPAGDLVGVAVERAGVPAVRAAFVGDSVWDVQAAVDADVRCVGVECGGTSEAELREAGAIEVFRDPDDLERRWSVLR